MDTTGEGSVLDVFEADYRPFEPQDSNFILKTWLRSYRSARRFLPDDEYYKNQRKLIVRLCQRSIVVVACDKTARDFILGFCVAEPLKTTVPNEPLIVHYAFTKLTYRNMGICRMMLEALGWHRDRQIYLTHWTYKAKDLTRAFKLVDNTYPLMELGNGEEHLAGEVQGFTDDALGGPEAGD